MGITGLLKGLQFCSQKRHIRDFSNQSLAVDASSWLHKSVYSIAERYVEALDDGRLDNACVQVATKYIVKRCQELLLHANIDRIYLVLDGTRCPLKVQTNNDREERRQKNLADARRFKRDGRPDKAEERYKSCIKISTAMANAVADAVTHRFANDNRVVCIHAPYEADAQLVKLCMDRIAHAVVTEDSDILVYSAACNFSFPILYKLERDTGVCDLVTMEWLLNPDAQTTWMQPCPDNKKNKGALDSILKSFSSRQLRRPGVGARLFVQACVLAGCDYCPSRLDGIGLVSAFKLLLDNSHRPPCARFHKILSSLSKKARAGISIEDYEELLAKSEAVFYYHPVIDLERRNVMPLLAPRTCEEVNVSELQHFSDHNPSLHRFERDWSFLGDFGSTTKAARHPIAEIDEVPVSEIIVDRNSTSQARLKKRSRVALAEYEGGATSGRSVVDLVNNVPRPSNPYAKKTRKRGEKGSREPLADVNSRKMPSKSNSSNSFEQFSHQPKPSGGGSIYVNSRQDVRFVKRKFGGGKPSYVNAAKTLCQKSTTRPQPRLQLSSVRCSRRGSHNEPDESELQVVASYDNPFALAELSVSNSSEEVIEVHPPVTECITKDAPFGNPDLDTDTLTTSKFFLSNYHTARRVTLEQDENSRFNEFDAPHINAATVDVKFNEVEALDASGKGFDQEALDDQSYKIPVDERLLARLEDQTPFGNVDNHYDVSSCEAVESPDHHTQLNARPRINDFSWVGMPSQERQGIDTPRMDRLIATPPIHGHRPLTTYFRFGSPPGKERSPLSVTSPTYARSTLNISSQPAFKSQGRSSRPNSTRQSKPGTITSFFPVKISDSNPFHGF